MLIFPERLTLDASQLIKSLGEEVAEYAGNPMTGTGNFEDGAASYSPWRQPLVPTGSLLFLNIHPLARKSETFVNSSTNEELEESAGGVSIVVLFNLSFVHEITSVNNSKKNKPQSGIIFLFLIAEFSSFYFVGLLMPDTFIGYRIDTYTGGIPV